MQFKNYTGGWEDRKLKADFTITNCFGRKETPNILLYNSHSKLKAGREFLVQVQEITGRQAHLRKRGSDSVNINRKGRVIWGSVLKEKNSGDRLYFRSQISDSFSVIAFTAILNQGPLSELKWLPCQDLNFRQIYYASTYLNAILYPRIKDTDHINLHV